MTAAVVTSLVAVIGTRPELIKIWPLADAAKQGSKFHIRPLFTGQHTYLLGQTFEAVMSDSPWRAELTAAASEAHREWSIGELIAAITTNLRSEAPGAVVVQGDTTSAFAGAIAASSLKIPVVHLEAGLRSGSKHDPFPEELHRRGITALADFHLAPTQSNRRNLLREGVPDETIAVTGNTVIDALTRVANTGQPWVDMSLKWLDVDVSPVVLVTLHRRELWGGRLAMLASKLHAFAQSAPSVSIVWPIHPSREVAEVVRPYANRLENLKVTDPLAYPDFVRILTRSCVVVTDSGGVQEEAATKGKRVLVVRNRTERSEAVEAGVSRLIGIEGQSLSRELNSAIFADGSPARSFEYGDGHAAPRCLDAIERWLRPDGMTEALRDVATSAPLSYVPQARNVPPQRAQHGEG